MVAIFGSKQKTFVIVTIALVAVAAFLYFTQPNTESTRLSQSVEVASGRKTADSPILALESESPKLINSNLDAPSPELDEAGPSTPIDVQYTNNSEVLDRLLTEDYLINRSTQSGCRSTHRLLYQLSQEERDDQWAEPQESLLRSVWNTTNGWSSPLSVSCKASLCEISGYRNRSQSEPGYWDNFKEKIRQSNLPEEFMRTRMIQGTTNDRRVHCTMHGCLWGRTTRTPTMSWATVTTAVIEFTATFRAFLFEFSNPCRDSCWTTRTWKTARLLVVSTFLFGSCVLSPSCSQDESLKILAAGSPKSEKHNSTAVSLRQFYFLQDEVSAIRFAEAQIGEAMSTEVLAWYVLNLVRSRAMERASRLASQCIDEFPVDPWCLFSSAAVAMGSRQTPEHEFTASIRQALSAEPDDPDFVWLYSEALRLRGQHNSMYLFLENRRNWFSVMRNCAINWHSHCVLCIKQAPEALVSWKLYFRCSTTPGNLIYTI